MPEYPVGSNAFDSLLAIGGLDRMQVACGYRIAMLGGSLKPSLRCGVRFVRGVTADRSTAHSAQSSSYASGRHG
jgi:hypothetical protein